MFKRGKVNSKNILLIFMILQPFLDSYVLYSDSVIEIFGFSPTTILRYLLIAIIFVMLFFTNLSKKETKYIFIYGITILIYTIIHHFVCISIDETLIYKSFKYNLLSEIFYLARLICPFLLVYIVYLLKPTKKEFKFAIQGSTIIFTLILLLMNIFVIAQTSYFSSYIEGNIIDWFTNNSISRYKLASKGWFNSANQIGGVAILLLPINFYYATKTLKIKDIIVLMLLILSCYSIGTRISTIGISLILIVLTILFYAFKLITKEKLKLKEFFVISIVSIFSIFIFCYAPIVNLSGNNLASLLKLNQVVNKNSNEEVVTEIPEYNGENLCNYLKLTSTSEEYYKELYPCDVNEKFWTTFIEKKYYKYVNNRLLEQLITDEVYQKITNNKVKLFGMSRSRFENAQIYLERDIVVHYFTIGIVGIIIFIVPYFILCGRIAIPKLIRKKLTFWDVCLMSSIILPIVVSYATGHILDELIITLYVGFCLGYLLHTNRNKNKNNIALTTENKDDNRKKILFVVDENRMGGVSILLEDIIKNIDRKKYNIDILVLHDVDNYLKKLPNDVNIIYGTSFFEAIDYNLSNLIKEKKIKLLIKKIYLIFLMKTCLIKHKIIKERQKILHKQYDVEIAFKDGFTAIFTAYGDSKKKIHWLHYEYKKYNANGNYPKLFNQILPTFDKIVAVSRTVMNDFNDIYHLNNKTTVIGNYIDTDRIKNISNEKCERTLNKNKINIVCVGRLHECKGFDRLIKAVSKLDKNHKEKIHIEICGDGLEENNLKSMIKEEKLNNIIFLKGRVSNPYKYIKNNDLFILCSHFETFGLVIVESMTLGVPVFALENANTNNLIKNNINGYIVKNNDEELYKGLLYLINNNKLLHKYKKNLKDYKYDNEKILKSIENLIDE